jgi:hypothetical protein
LNLVNEFDEEVGPKTLIRSGRDEVVEPHESRLEGLGLGILKLGEHHLHDCGVVRLDSSTERVICQRLPKKKKKEKRKKKFRPRGESDLRRETRKNCF